MLTRLQGANDANDFLWNLKDVQLLFTGALSTECDCMTEVTAPCGAQLNEQLEAKLGLVETSLRPV